MAKIVGLGGSLARVSRSRTALKRALAGAEAAGAEIELLDLRELDLPMYNPDLADPTEGAEHLLASCYAADGLIWSSPLYQGTISGAFKNALDWLHLIGTRDPPYLHDKVIGLLSAAGARTASRPSTRWSSRCARFAAGRPVCRADLGRGLHPHGGAGRRRLI